MSHTETLETPRPKMVVSLPLPCGVGEVAEALKAIAANFERVHGRPVTDNREIAAEYTDTNLRFWFEIPVEDKVGRHHPAYAEQETHGGD